MAKIDRYDGNLKAFAADATGNERTIFGDTAQSDTLDANITAAFLRGWGIVGVNENPTKQDFDGLGFTLGQLIAYLHQQGIPEWNTSQEYYQGSVVTTLAGIYRLKSGGDGTVDPDSDDGVNWQLSPTRAQVDAKAPQATTYTEAEVDSLLNAKADAVDVPLYQEQVIDLGSPFNGDDSVMVVKIGKTVTVTSRGSLSHTSSSFVQSSGTLPVWARPPTTIRNVATTSGANTVKVGIQPDGVFQLSYDNTDTGNSVAVSSTGSPVSLSYNVF